MQLLIVNVFTLSRCTSPVASRRALGRLAVYAAGLNASLRAWLAGQDPSPSWLLAAEPVPAGEFRLAPAAAREFVEITVVARLAALVLAGADDPDRRHRAQELIRARACALHVPDTTDALELVRAIADQGIADGSREAIGTAHRTLAELLGSATSPPACEQKLELERLAGARRRPVDSMAALLDGIRAEVVLGMRGHDPWEQLLRVSGAVSATLARDARP